MELLRTEDVNRIARSTFSESLMFTCEESGFLELCPILHKKIFAGETYIFLILLYFIFIAFLRKHKIQILKSK